MDFAQVNHFLEIYRIGDYAGLLGLVISLVGFFVTIRTSLKTRTAAAQASAAVESIRGDLRKGDTVADFSSALAIMDEIKRMHRSTNLHLLPDRYSQLRRFLVSIRSSNPLLSDADQGTIQNAIAQFSASERLVERALEGKGVMSTAKMNSLVSKHSEAIQELLVRVKSEITKGGDV
ncbi:hypothetical protein [Pseudomonas sp. St316]|uniref:hypothetical protein n=1 Tax=Pseudomonas sp. St316 TaxID=2678257 RepID=UPI001BB3FE5A|nr:hypothetical protein [Pseudomonas sp. St316]BBP57788.1 hypothetical protein PHLH4_13780 [Pseudomonas sp. St316]